MSVNRRGFRAGFVLSLFPARRSRRPRPALVHGYGWAHSTGPAGSMVSGGANGSRLCNPDHVVEHLSRDGGFTLLGRQDAGAQLWSDDRLVAPDRGFRETAPAVACCFLPRHAAPLCSRPDVVIALALCLSALPVRHRRGTWWDDDVRRRIGLMTDDRLVHGKRSLKTVVFSA